MEKMQPIIQSALLSSIPKLRHGFLANYSPAARDALAKLEPEIATVKQVHGDLLLFTESHEKRAREADALATAKARLPVGVYSADCAPILVVALAGNSPCAVMAIHAGWRGTAMEIAAKSLLAFQLKLGRGLRFAAAIGPCIGYESFEVGQEVVDAFPGCLENGIARFLRLEGEKKKYLFHLAGENQRQLVATAKKSSIPLELDVLPLCTFSNPLPSFRRDREKAGRILSYLTFEE
jgi:YfiH family protein